MHFGSLVAAVGSYLEARCAGGEWYLRIEDLDAAREVPDAADLLQGALERLGFEWDGPVERQSARTELYETALRELQAAGRVYACTCSRADIRRRTGLEPGASEELRYPGTCRDTPAVGGPSAWRFRVHAGEQTFADRLQGRVSVDVEAQIGDFVVRRRDGPHAYQLAVVVDDAIQGITDVVRGADLLDNTPRQRLLQEALGLPMPTTAHLPLAVDEVGRKLSKSTQAPAIVLARPAESLWQALSFLRQRPPPELCGAPVAELWSWARSHWSLAPLTGIRVLPAWQPSAGDQDGFGTVKRMD